MLLPNLGVKVFVQRPHLYHIVDMLEGEISAAGVPDKRDRKLVSFQDEVEVSATFYPEQFGVFLWRMVPHIEEDFGPDQVHQVIRLLDSMELNETGVHNQKVSFRGRRVPFRITLHRYESEGAQAVVVYITSGCALCRVFEEEVKNFYTQISGQSEAGEEYHLQQIKAKKKIHLQES